MNDWASIADKGGSLAIAIFVIMALVRGWLVTGPTYAALERERAREQARADRWEALALKSTNLAEAATDAAEIKAREKLRLERMATEVAEAKARGEIT